MTACKIDGCELPTKTRGWCTGHYSRWLRTGDTGPAKMWDRAPQACEIEDCERQRKSRGLCNLHRQRRDRNGDPLLVFEASGPGRRLWKGDEIAYETAHQRVRRVRGAAREWLCVTCGRPAEDWAYDNADPYEKTHAQGWRYSTDIDHYRPMCKSCHVTADYARRRQEAS